VIKGLHFVKKSKPGKPIRWYVYASRNGGPCILKTVGPKKPVLSREHIAKLLEALPPKDEGTLAELIRKWRRSPEWKRLATGTVATWGFALDAIEGKWGSTPLAVWNDYRMVSKVVDWRDSRANTPRAADIGVTVLSRLLEFGRLRALLRINVAGKIPAIYEGADRAEIIWTQADVSAYYAAADGEKGRGEPAKDILDLATCTGMRRSDLAAVTWDEVFDQAIVRVALKKSRGRRRRAVIPLTDETRAILARLKTRKRAQGVKNLLVNSFGRRWSPGSLAQAFNVTRNAANGGAGIVHCGNPELGEPDKTKHLHDCRGTFVTHLCRTDLTDVEIANIVAWSPENVGRVRRIYVDDAQVVVALAERIAKASVNRAVNQRGI